MINQTASELLSLPKGGGAVRGLGETFQPDLHTGTGSYRIPLEVPPGRPGLQPRLALVYSSGGGNGPFGLGWSLDIPGVRRKTAKRLPRYDDSDIFVLSGAEDLVPVPGGDPEAGEQRYRPRVEGLFARIVHHTSPDGDYWEVWSGDGLVSRYDPAVVHPDDDPQKPRRILAWHISETADPLGNRMTFTHTHDPAGPQRYLAEVRYADYGDDRDDPQYLVAIRFRYEQRPDVLTDRRGGFAVPTSLRCTRIETWTGEPDARQLARSVELTYADQLSAPVGNGNSLLARVVVTGHDGNVPPQALAPLAFGYSAWAPEKRRYQPLAGPGAAAPATLGDGDADLVDLFGDGLPDVLQLNGIARYWRNRGQGRFDPPRPLPYTPAGAALGKPGMQLADLDGDGRTDLLISDATHAGFWPLANNGGFDPHRYVAYRTAPAVELTDPQLRLVDLDGDGIPDALRTGPAGLEVYYHQREAGWTRARVPTEGAVPPVSFADPRVRLADMTGDGLTDIVLVHDGAVSYWPNLGYARFDPPVRMANPPRFGEGPGFGPGGFDPARLLVGDVDGDGCADLVYVGDRSTMVWINQGGSRFTDPVTVPGTPRTAAARAIRLADMLGTGTSGVLWTYDPGSQRDSSYKFLDLTGGAKPYLLSSIDNNMGARTTIAYAPSTGYATADAHAKTPWRTTLPFPVQVVAHIKVEDEFSQSTLTSEFHYHHGYWDGVEREFRGFGRVDQHDTLLTSPDGHASPPTELRTWFDQGPVGPEHGGWQELDLSGEYWPDDHGLLGATDTSALPAGLPRRREREVLRALAGRVVRSELYALDGDTRHDRPYTVTEHAYTVVPVLDNRSPDDPEWLAHPVVAAYAVAERTTQWERGQDPMTTVRFTGGHDAYGRPHHLFEVAVPRGRDPRQPAPAGPPYLATLTLTDYATADDPTSYLTDRVARSARYQLRNNGSPTLAALHAGALDGTTRRRIRALTVHQYDGDAFTGLPVGQLGEHGLLVRTEQLAVPDWLAARLWPTGPPPYLTGAPDPWPEEYPDGFRAALAHGAGYLRHETDDVYQAGYYVATAQTCYDVHDNPAGRGLPTVQRDPRGHDTTIGYDAYQLLPTRVTDPAGLVRNADYDYRVLKPHTVTDVNGNRSQVGYTPLGMVAWTATLGKPGEQGGDTPARPAVRFAYGLSVYTDSPPGARQPVWASSLRCTEHYWAIIELENKQRAAAGHPPLSEAEIAALFPDDEPDQFPERFICGVEYSDGFGRSLQTRTQTDSFVVDDLGLPVDVEQPPSDLIGHDEPDGADPIVVVGGWKAYDNKGRVVRAWEPFFARGWDYQRPTPEQLANLACTTTAYDPRGAVTRVTYPDGSNDLTVQGIPSDLHQPEDYRPSPWVAFAYDPNDNAARTHPELALSIPSLCDTPTSTWVDALGRVTGTARRTTSTRSVVTRQRLDIDGRVAKLIDPLGRTVAHTRHDLLGRLWWSNLLDAGLTTQVIDAAGAPLERGDGKGAITLTSYDELNRPARQWARDRAGGRVSLRQVTIYGDDPASGLIPLAAAAVNLLGRVYCSYDEAGLVYTSAYDIDGHAVEQTRRVLRTSLLLSRLPTPTGSWEDTSDVLDWQPHEWTTFADHAEALLDATSYTVSARYDALDRRTRLIHPLDADGHRRVEEACYGRSGKLVMLTLDGVPHLQTAAYNARGQQVLAALGNGVLVRRAFCPKTFRLARLHSEAATEDSHGGHWRPVYDNGIRQVRQDHGYSYDLVGNLLTLADRTPGCGVLPGPPDALNRTFVYDPLYRLTRATGRECDIPPPAPWAPAPRGTDVTKTRGYIETYGYDDADNLLTLTRDAPAVAPHVTTVRAATLAPAGNRLATMTFPSQSVPYSYDPCGNLTRETTSRRFEWDHLNRLVTYRTQADGADPSLYAQYRYDESGRRILKLVRNQGGGLEITIYPGEGLNRVVRVRGDISTVHDELNLAIDDLYLLRRRIGPPLPDDRRDDDVEYPLGDHYGNIEATLDSMGAVVSREEYTPYGETSYGSYSHKRYRFDGKERDEESGAVYAGARYYFPWIFRWASADPRGYADALNLFSYVRDNPVRLIDPDGRRPRLTSWLLTGEWEPTAAQMETAMEPVYRTNTNFNTAASYAALVGVTRFFENTFLLGYDIGRFVFWDDYKDNMAVETARALHERGPAAIPASINQQMRQIAQGDAVAFGEFGFSLYGVADGFANLKPIKMDFSFETLKIVVPEIAVGASKATAIVGVTGLEGVVAPAFMMSTPKTDKPQTHAVGERLLSAKEKHRIEIKEAINEFLASGGTITQLPAVMHRHHLLPQSLKGLFEARGLDIEKFTIPLSPETHLLKVHGGAASGGLWVNTWREFFAASPAATQQQVLEQLAIMRKGFGI